MSKKKDFTLVAIAGWLLLVFVIAVTVFLFTKDSYNGQEITGWEVLKRENPGFWSWIVIGTILGAAALYLAYANESGAGKLGQKLSGKSWQTIALIILAFLLICGPWGKACTDKTNGGHTLEKKLQ